MLSYGSLGLVAVVFFIVWRVARRGMQLGYFIFFFAIGFVLVQVAGSPFKTDHLPVPLPIPVAGGLAFGAIATFIRAKVFKVVGAVAMLAIAGTASNLWSKAEPPDAERAKKQAEMLAHN